MHMKDKFSDFLTFRKLMKAPIFGLMTHKDRREMETKRIIGMKNRLTYLPDARCIYISRESLV